MCAIVALPILRLHRLGNTVPTMEIRPAPNLPVRAMGCARVGVECIPQHTRKLGNRRGYPGDHRVRRVVGTEERFQQGSSKR